MEHANVVSLVICSSYHWIWNSKASSHVIQKEQ